MSPTARPVPGSVCAAMRFSSAKMCSLARPCVSKASGMKCRPRLYAACSYLWSFLPSAIASAAPATGRFERATYDGALG